MFLDPKNGLIDFVQHENEFRCFKRVQDPQEMGVTGTLQDSSKQNIYSLQHTCGQTGGVSDPQLEALYT